jgi:hypothetical protein
MNNLQGLKRVASIASLVIIAICLYAMGKAIWISQTTGALQVTTGESRATINLTQEGHQAVLIGAGHAKVRLKPGSYQVVARAGANQAASTVSVQKRQVIKTNLVLQKGPQLPSVDDINFSGMVSLTDAGITSSQIKVLELEFFEYKTSAGIVSIDSQSIYPHAHNPNTYISFTTDFNATIDSKLYNARINYTGLDDIHLTLYNPQNHQLVFDSSASSANL